MKIVNFPKELLLLISEYLLSDPEQRWTYGNSEHEQDWIHFTATSRSFQSLRKESVYFNLTPEYCLEYVRNKNFRERVFRSVNDIQKQIAINLCDLCLENDDISSLSGVNYLCLDLSVLPEDFSLENIYCFSLWALSPLNLSNFRNVSVLNLSNGGNIDFSQLPPSVKSLTMGNVQSFFPLSPDFPFSQIDELTIEDSRITDDDLHYFSPFVKKLTLGSDAISDLSTTTFPLLKHLTLSGCIRVNSIPSSLSQQLESLQVLNCSEFSFLSSFTFPFLSVLSLTVCSSIQDMDFHLFPSLRYVFISYCHGIRSLKVDNPPSNDSLQSLYKMSIRSCPVLTELKFSRDIGYLTVEDCLPLERIDIADCFRVYSLMIISNGNCHHLSQEEYRFPSISGRINLQQLVWETQEEEEEEIPYEM
jgi:hypothetical protein